MTEPIIRKLKKDDLQNGFLTTLDSLRQTSNIEAKKAELDGKIIGATTLLIEQKFIHDGGLVGHIEDVVVDKNYQGQRIGEKIMKYLLEIAKNQGCYKTILDCTDDVKQFYEKLGFKHVANELRFDHN